MSELLLLCFYIASLWLRWFLWGDPMLEVFAPFFLCVWSQMLWRNLPISVVSMFFAQKPKIRWIVRIYDIMDRFLRKSLILPKNFLYFGSNVVEYQGIVNLSRCGSKSYTLVVLDNSKVTFPGEREHSVFCPSLSIVFWLYMVLQYQSSMLLNFLVFYTFCWYFIKTGCFSVLNFSIKLSSSYINCLNLMSCWLLIIFMIGSSVTLGDFPSRLLKLYLYIVLLDW